jgi:hypothetical protein|tara:strand:- start:322 stop:579 length:258 start_codon:yes stop_codon:yes gene_type:complete
MEKIIFFVLVIPILVFVLYLGGNAIMKGMNAKNTNKLNKENEENTNSFNHETKLSDEIDKLNKLLEDGVLTQEEFEKAKKKLLDN